jgi:hypothetical protein
MLHKWTILVLCVLTGVTLELGLSALSGRREAWDSALYWTLGIPGALVASAAIGLVSRKRDWLWTLAIVPSQVITMMLRDGEVGGLWPLAIVLSAILSAPFVVAAFLGSRFRS